MISLQLYSDILSVCLSLLIIACILICRARLQARQLQIAALCVASISTLGSLAYSNIFLLPICSLCYYQRMWMYPLIVLLGYGIYKKSNEIFQAGIIFSLIGASIALFHYAGHIQAFFIDEKQQSFLPCSEVGLIPSCTQTYVISFGFVTIPLMAAIAFGVIAFLLYKSQKIHHS